MKYTFSNLLILFYFVYVKFKFWKLRYIEKISIFFINKLNIKILYIIYLIKLYTKDDIRNIKIYNPEIDLESNIYVSYIDNQTEFDPTIRLLWKWKYTGLELSDLDPNALLYFNYEGKKYILCLNDQTYYYYNINSGQKSENFEIQFNQIELRVNF